MTSPTAIAGAAVEVHRRIAPYARTTPVELLSAPGAAARVFAKCENMQVTGSFKVRGALSALTEDPTTRSVVTASTGNHGAAVAYAGHQLGIGVTVFAPESADHSKLSAIKRWGATVELVAGDPINAELAGRTAAKSHAPYISPYNHPSVIAGQATIGLELISQLGQVDMLVASVGGGGLISGIASVLRAHNPSLCVVGAAPANSAVMMESVAAGELLDLQSRPTLSDGTAGGVEAGTITFPLCRELVDTWVRVDETQIRSSLATYIGRHHQLIEGAAAVALAAIEHPSVSRRIEGDTTVAVILCGANIARATLRQVLGE